jgi:hypothetical protein
MELELNNKLVLSPEFQHARRENGLTIRYLAQCLINDIIFPNQEGINAFINKCHLGNGEDCSNDFTGRWEYWFLFHLEDFGSEDKSEIDILLKNNNTLFVVEVKAFTNPNASDVKREIIRNYLTIQKIVESENKYFNDITDIYPVLLYSLSMHEYCNHSSNAFSYFTEEYLYKKGKFHKQMMQVWSTNAARNPSLENNQLAQTIVEAISNKLLFINWDDVMECIDLLNVDNKFDDIITEMIDKRDYKRDIKLIKNQN